MALLKPSESDRSMSVQRTPAMVEMLTSIWRSVLNRSSVGIDDSFFRIGGSDASADLLFAEISRRLDRELPSAIIFRAPTIATLASLLDQPAHPRYLSEGQRLRLSAQRTKNRIAAMKQRTIRSAFSYFADQLERRLDAAGVHIRGLRVPEGPPLSLAHTTLRVKRKAYVALENYRPRLYSGKIKFIRSETDTYFPGDPFPVWAHLATTFEVETVRGSHLNMVTTHFEGLATVLTKYVIEAAAP